MKALVSPCALHRSDRTVQSNSGICPREREEIEKVDVAERGGGWTKDIRALASVSRKRRLFEDVWEHPDSPVASWRKDNILFAFAFR